jgi:subtilisin-like proprotein convertase family protein/endonuclease/exonuclease/phosphatase family metal-dependent hydrolase
MKVRSIVSILLGLLVLAAVWLCWPRSSQRAADRAVIATAALATNSVAAAAVAPNNSGVADDVSTSAAVTNRLAFRLTNASKDIETWIRTPHAIVLENALVDTDQKLNLAIPKHLKAAGDPGAYLVQSKTAVPAQLQALLKSVGAEFISYIPNNACLVRISPSTASALRANPLVQAVLPWEPYYKVQSSLLGLAVQQKALPVGQILTLGLFNHNASATVAQIEQLGGTVVATDRSPFGPIVRISPPKDWTALLQLPGVQRLEPTHRRVLANDLTRATLGVATNTVTTNSYLNLTGSNVLVEVNDTGIDLNHPALLSRVFVDALGSGLDTDGHGTHVAGIIAGDGAQSSTVTNARGSIMPGTNTQFRGQAPLAKLYSVGFLGNDTNFLVSDQNLQEAPARTNALISNNSWVNDGVNEYDLSAASYDAATRDSLTDVTGPQPVLFVFAAGNDGNGGSGGSGGNADSILSPGTAKDVITVGALEQFRNITNLVTPLFGTTNDAQAIWQTRTDSGSQVADYSARGNVGIQTEGAYGRFKPDVIAPGSFVVSARSTTWDTNAYFNVTNYHTATYTYQVVTSNTLNYFPPLSVPQNAIGVVITVKANSKSPTPFPNLPIYISATGVPDATTYDITGNNRVAIPPASGGVIACIQSLTNSSLLFGIGLGPGTNLSVSYDVTTQVITTNDLGDELAVLHGLDDRLCSPFNGNLLYRYETGTSVAAPAISGVLALMQDFFTNTLRLTPSPALLKAMLINGARVSGSYKFAVTNTINYQGWGLAKLSNSIPLALTNTAAPGTNGVPLFFVDQSPTNTLATGDRRTYLVTVPSIAARGQPLRVTLAWTDPPGNPAAAVKLVNDLDLVITNLSNGQIYYGNNFSGSGTPPFSQGGTNTTADVINNVENIYLSPTLGTNYSITVVGRSVNVNAVTLEQTNIVQDFALVIANGDGNNTNGFTVTAAAPSLVSITAPVTTYIQNTNGILFNQIAGGNAPWLSTNTLAFGTNSGYATNAVLSIGQTNQWHFFIVTNTFAVTNANFTNAAFITFLPNTMATPRLGTYSSQAQNYTRPEADIELFVADSLHDLIATSLTNLNSQTISNCLSGLNGDGASLSRGGTEFVAYNNSVANQIYYVGVKCEDQMAGRFAFVSVFSDKPFSQLNDDGSQTVNGQLVPTTIPDGNNAQAGVSYSIGLALYPMSIRRVTVTNVITHENFGDLVGGLTHDTQYSFLNNHDAFGAVVATNLIYDDSGEGDTNRTMRTDSPGSLRNFTGKQAVGLWVLNEIDDAQTQTGRVDNFALRIYPHNDLTHQPFTTNSVPPFSWFYDFVDVPVGNTNLLVVATNLTTPYIPAIQLYLAYDTQPNFSNYLARADLTNGPLQNGNSISYGPPLAPGRYYVGLYNPDSVTHNVLLGAFLRFDAAAVTTLNFRSTEPVPLLDDAVTYDSIFITNTAPVQAFNLGLRVDHERISDLVFHLISPDGTRYLMMENRGYQTTNGAGITMLTTNIINQTAKGGAAPDTNSFDVGMTSGTFPITYNFYTAPDEMTVYYGTNITPANLILDTGFTNNPSLGAGAQNTAPVTVNVTFPPPTATASSTVLTIIINQFGNTHTNTAWVYTAGGILTNYNYLYFTEDTNLTTTPIKFAATPYWPLVTTNYIVQTNISFTTNNTTLSLGSFDAATAGEYLSASNVDGWNIASNQVSVVSDSFNANAGSQFLALANGSISRTINTVPGGTNILRYAYRGPGIVSWWRGEGNANDSIGGNNGVLTNGASFAAGKVGQGFSLNGINQVVQIPHSASLSFTNQLTMEFLYNDLWSSIAYGLLTKRPLAPGSCNYGINVTPTFQLYFEVSTLPFQVSPTAMSSTGTLHHVSASLEQINATQVRAKTYIDGVLKTTGTLSGNLANTTNNRPVVIGGDSPTTDFFKGIIDEVSIYNRALSASEAQAIYAAGSAGKFDASTFSVSPAQSLAKAAINISGAGSTVFFGSNTNWQTNTISFVAITNSSVIQVTGLQPGMLLDSFALTSFTAITNYTTNIVVTVSNRYVLPEQSLDTLIGTIPYGEWQLEVLDNRAGATNNANLLSWQLGFTFANTNMIPAPVLPAIANITVIETTLMTVTNTATNAFNLPMTYTLVASPGITNAFISTNGIITWTPTEDQGPSTNLFVTTVSDNNVPVNSSQNSFLVIVLESNLPPVINFPTATNTLFITETEYFATNILVTDLDVPTNALTFAFLSAVNIGGAHINSGFTISTNGVISWTPDETNGPSTNIITFTVTDTNPPAINTTSFTVTNSFTLVVLESNLPPVLTLPPSTNINELVAWSAQATATDPDVPTNTLTFALVNGPTGLTVSSNGLISWLPNELQGPGDYTISVSVTDNGVPPLSVTNAFNIHVNEVNLPPAFPFTPPDTTIFELTTLIVTNTAIDTDFPLNPLTYVLVVTPTVTNASISSNGVITWTPTELQGSNAYQFTTFVTDTNQFALTNQSFLISNIFFVTVLKTNSAPVWTNGYPAVVMDELTTTNVAAGAVDLDVPTNSFTYSLPTNTPPWVTVDTNSGVVTLAPQEVDGPTNIIVTVIVTDDGVPPKSSSTNFTVTVNEVNTAPFWPASTPTNYLLIVTNVFVLTNAATDLDVPTNQLTYTLLSGPANSVIDTNTGVITWPSTAADLGSNYTFITVATDTNVDALINKTLSGTNTFVLTVIASNTAPFWATNIADVVMDELTVTNILVTGLDTDTPPNHLTYTLLNAPTGMSITNIGTNSYLNWTPSEAQGPGVYSNILVVVSDNVFPTPLMATNLPFTITVNEVNVAPQFVLTPPDRSVEVGSPLIVTNRATDSDLPTNTLTYSLLVAPLGATINSGNGVITWTPSLAQTSSTNRFTTVVTDNGLPPLSATNSYLVYTGNLLPTDGSNWVSLLQYNVKGNGAPDWSTNSPQVQAIGRELTYLNPDIITFNEIPENMKDEMTNWANGFLQGYTVVVSPGTDGFIHSAIASRFPITRTSSWLDGADLNPYGYTNSNFTRDLFEAQINVPGFPQPLHVFTTHLKSTAGATDGGPALKRAAEAAAITNFFATNLFVLYPNDPYTLSGDMNEGDTNALAIQQLINSSSGLHLTNPTNPFSGSGNTFSSTIPNERIDYIMPCDLLFSNISMSQVFRSDLLTPLPSTLNINDSQTASDHLPVQMSFNNPYLAVIDTNDVPTNTPVAAGSIRYFAIHVPANADWATNILLSASGPLNLFFNQTNLPTGKKPGDYTLLAGSLGGIGNPIMGTNTTPRLIPGSTYYLGVQNTNNFLVTFGLKVNFHLVLPAPIPFTSIIATNIGGTNGYLLTWLAPTNYQFHLQWTPALAPANWHIFNGVISYLAPNSATNAVFQYFDNGARYYDGGTPLAGSPTATFDPQRFYRLQLLNSPTNTQPFFVRATPAMQLVNPPFTLTVTNVAGDWDFPAQTLTYFVTNSLAGTNLSSVSASGVITWTPTSAQSGQTNVITTIVTDNGVPAKSVTNSFSVVVAALPAFSSITLGTNGVNFSWTAATNQQFQIRWTTNLAAPITWTLLPNNLTPDTIVSTNTLFNYVDTNALLLMKFYQLILLP